MSNASAVLRADVRNLTSSRVMQPDVVLCCAVCADEPGYYRVQRSHRKAGQVIAAGTCQVRACTLPSKRLMPIVRHPLMYAFAMNHDLLACSDECLKHWRVHQSCI